MNSPGMCRAWSAGALLVMMLAPSMIYASNDPSIEIWVASTSEGVAGAVSQGLARVEFESKLDNSRIRSEIRRVDGSPLWLYVEDLTSDDPPHMEIAGAPFEGNYAPEAMEVLKRIGSSPEGELIRVLAFELCLRVPGKHLVGYRRGLETAYQAMQVGYSDSQRTTPPGPQPVPRFRPIDTASGGHAASGRQTEDYLFGPEGGYVVKTQHRELVFANNFLSDDHERVRATLGKLPVTPHDDPNIGNSCFGMCGKGCTNDWSCRGFQGWSHQWVSPLTSSVRATCSCNMPIQFIDPCSDFVPGSWKTTTYTTSGNMMHTITGWSSLGCIWHDSCCRSRWCWTCVVEGALAASECALGIGWQVSWSYVAPASTSYSTYDTTGCRWDCPSCDSGIWWVDPIEVEP